MSESVNYARSLNRKEIHRHIYLQLGGGVVDVNLTKCQYDEAVDSAVRWWRAKKGLKKSFMLQLSPNKSEYDLPEEVDTVVEVIPTEYGQHSTYRMIDSFYEPGDGLPLGILGSNGAGFPGALTQAMQYEKLLEKVSATDFAWEQDNGSQKLRILTARISSLACRVFYLARSFNIALLPAIDNDLVVRFALASARKILSQVWGKYTDGFPGAQGNRSLNYSMQAELAQSEMEKLNEEIKESAKPAPIMWGR